MQDRDTKFTAAFEETLKKSGLRVQKTAYLSPNTVAFVERFIRTLGQECVDHFAIFGERHLNQPCSAFVDYYHRLRPHESKENDLLVPGAPRRRSKNKPRQPSLTWFPVRDPL